MDAINDLPDYVEEIGDSLRNFDESLDATLWERLTEKALRLYVSILVVVEGMLGWLNEGATSKIPIPVC